MDPRLDIIGERIKGVKRLIAVAGGKGGVGKSSVASVLALKLASQGRAVGLLDLDFCGPTPHLILGADTSEFPKEDKGVIPPKVAGIKLMSVAYYSKEANPLRGSELSNSIKELLAVTLWGKLDYLILDMPPGTSDTFLDVAKLLKPEFILITTPSKLSKATVEKNKNLIEEMGLKVVATIENLGKDIRTDSSFEQAVGSTKLLLNTQFSADLNKITEQLKRNLNTT